MNSVETPGVFYIKENKFITVLRALSYIGVFFAVQVFVSLIVSVYIGDSIDSVGMTVAEYSDAVNARANELATMISAVSNIAVIAVVAVIYMLFNRRTNPRRTDFCEWFSLGKTRPLTSVYALICGISLNFTLSFVFNIIVTMFPQTSEALKGSEYGGSNFWFIMAVVIMAPITEEIIFRGMTMKRFERIMPSFWAAFVTAVLFGVAHGELVQGLYAFALGLILGLVFCNNGAVYVNMLVHFGFNAVNILNIIFPGELGTVGKSVYNALIILSIPVSIILCIILVHGKDNAKRSRPFFTMPKDDLFPLTQIYIAKERNRESVTPQATLDGGNNGNNGNGNNGNGNNGNGNNGNNVNDGNNGGAI